MKEEITEVEQEDIITNREIKIEVFRHFPQTANVKKSRDQVPAVRVAVWSSRLDVK